MHGSCSWAEAQAAHCTAHGSRNWFVGKQLLQLKRGAALQAASHVAALAACYAEAQEPPVQFFNAILQVILTIKEMWCKDTDKICIMMVIAGSGACYDGNIVCRDAQSAVLLRKH